MKASASTCLAVGVLAVAHVGCGPSGGGPSGVVERDSAGLAIIEHRGTPTARLTLSDAPVLTIGRAEGGDAYVFDGIVDALRLADGRVVVADGGSREIRFYGADGRHVLSAGGAGDGPGEFRQIGGLALLSGELIGAWDPGAVRLSLLGPDGRLLRGLDLTEVAGSRRPELHGAFDDGSFVVSTDAESIDELFSSEGVRRPPVAYVRFDLEGRRMGTVLTAPGREVTISASERGGQVALRMFGRQTVADVVGRTIYVADNDRYEIRVHTPDGTALFSLRKPHVAAPVTEEHLWAAWQERLRAYPSGLREQVEADLRTGDIDDTPHNETLPALLGIRAIDEGAVWVLESVVPGEPERWVRLGRDGTHEWVEMPPRFRALRFESSSVLGVARDELDVERLQIFELRRSR